MNDHRTRAFLSFPLVESARQELRASLYSVALAGMTASIARETAIALSIFIGIPSVEYRRRRVN